VAYAEINDPALNLAAQLSKLAHPPWSTAGLRRRPTDGPTARRGRVPGATGIASRVTLRSKSRWVMDRSLRKQNPMKKRKKLALSSLELDRQQHLNSRTTILRSEISCGREPWSGLENTAIAYRRRWREYRSVDSIPPERRTEAAGDGWVRVDGVNRRPVSQQPRDRLNKIFRPQNRGAAIQILPATSSSEDDPRSLRFSNGF
jgi:hypothetical protein